MKKIKEILINKNSYKYILSFVLVIVLLVMVGGISYAMFDYSRTGTKENVITTGEIRVAFAEQNNIKLQNRYAETDTQGLANTDPNSQMTFTVSSNITGDATVNYAVGLVDIVEGATLTQDYVKIYLEKNGSAASGFDENSGRIIASFNSSSYFGLLGEYVIARGSFSNSQVDTYKLKAWIDETYNLPITDTSNSNVHSNTTTTETFSFKIKVVSKDEYISSPNAPELAKNMIPVTYDGENWVKADSTNANNSWYNYSDKKWANAVTVIDDRYNPRSDLTDAPVGTPIPMERINTMLVWIPRFSATTNGSYNGGTIETPGAFYIEFVKNDKAAHDAFTFGNQNLSGFWVGKFENSSDTICTLTSYSAVGEGCNKTSIRPKILPNAVPWGGAMVSTYFYNILNMTGSGNQYGFDKTVDTTLDTHMLKNNEWGAVAYLTQSIYGRCSTSTMCNEIGTNNFYSNGDFKTGYGAPAGSSGNVTRDEYVTPQPYNTAQGMDASTTGNIYGVYDMSGGAYEYVMGVYWDKIKKYSGQSSKYMNNHSGFNGWLSEDSTNYASGVDYPSDDKYYNLYTTSEEYDDNNKLQHALIETKGWYDGTTHFVVSGVQWFNRGGYAVASNGIFSYDYSSGQALSTYASRTSLIIN